MKHAIIYESKWSWKIFINFSLECLSSQFIRQEELIYENYWSLLTSLIIINFNLVKELMLGEVRIHNFQRIRKRQSEKQAKQYIITPPKHQQKNRIWNIKRKIQKQNGYAYECNRQSKTLKWMQQQFEGKLVKYLGGGAQVHKRSRIDKVHLKEKLNFSNSPNPLIAPFRRINQRIQNILLSKGFDAIVRSIK